MKNQGYKSLPHWHYLLYIILNFGGISTTLVDKLQTLTVKRTGIPGVFNDTTIGHIYRSPDKELFVCSRVVSLYINADA